MVELLDSDTGEELKEKVDLVAKNGLLTEGVVNAARVVVESNEAAGQDPEIIELLRSVYDVLLRKFKEMYAPKAKAALEFGSTLMDVFTAEDLEAMVGMALTILFLFFFFPFQSGDHPLPPSPPKNFIFYLFCIHFVLASFHLVK